MTVQTRIMLFIVGSGFLASLLFSLVVFYEMVEQPFNLLDTVLHEEGTRVVRSLVDSPETSMTERGRQNLGIDQYWIEIRGAANNSLIFRSKLAEDIPLVALPSGSVAIVHPQIIQEQPLSKTTPPVLRMTSFLVERAGQHFRVQIGRPMEKLHEEIGEVVYGLLAGLIFSTLVLCAVSRWVAKKILQPVQHIKDLARDISEQNLSRRIPLQEPGDEISELARTINHMLDRLQHSFNRQRTFLYATSHELKTPLASIRLAIDEILSRETAEGLALVQEDFLRISQQSFRLERLVKDQLTLSSLETMTGGKWNPVDLSTLLGSLVEEFSLLAEEGSIAMQAMIEPDCVVQGDEGKLQRALINILDNALKFTRKEGQIEISAALRTDTVVITVANTGAGLDEAECKEVFDPFFRGEKSRALEFGGFGLGLTIVKKIIELHQGSITFSSGLEQRTTVMLRLPRL
ncbi:HAMP domain-containing histidine kinase [Desulfobulbus rhabdoformis]|uniref:sensor histidine kinase n=1 Tax=Desulfobulbus rhabdoformis TaxID=34032 RepID=UPI0019662EF3|nr:HAMP domain-containing sensor histidine kinase [Desulfobulbus rhabdoformis]MBM9613560.1 HAMP domain-containing histidine kinase [Desulfobulbus rhabdoformis]